MSNQFFLALLSANLLLYRAENITSFNMFKGLKALLAGVLAGTALGILFAPKKGDEIRKNIKKEVKGGGTGFSTIKDTIVEMGHDIGDFSKGTYGELNKHESFRKGVKTVKGYAAKAKKEAKNIIDDTIPSAKRKQAAKAIKKAAEVAKSASAKAKTVVKKVAKRIADTE